MGSLRANAVWLALIAAGLGLGALVLAAWPEPTVKVVRLPYGEAMPKTPALERAPARAERAEPAAETAGVWEPALPAPDAQAPAEEEAAGRVLAVVEQGPADAGPAPIPSALDLDERYVQEPPEELGAEPLPGTVLTPAAPPASG